MNRKIKPWRSTHREEGVRIRRDDANPHWLDVVCECGALLGIVVLPSDPLDPSFLRGVERYADHQLRQHRCFLKWYDRQRPRNRWLGANPPKNAMPYIRPELRFHSIPHALPRLERLALRSYNRHTDPP